MFTDTKDKAKDIRTASVIGLVGNAILASLKVVAGILSRSSALIGDGIDSSADVLISVVTLVVVRVISKPADVEHPYGHGRAETVATVFLSFIIFFAGAQLIVNSISELISKQPHVAPSIMALIVTVVSIVGKLLLAWSQSLLGKRAESSMIQANAKNMAGDVLISASVLVALVISKLTGSSYADIIIAILIGAWIIKIAVGIFLKANLELMDGNSDMEPYHVIVDAVHAVPGANHPHRVRMRQIAGLWDIVLDVNVDPNLTVLEAHNIACDIEHEIKTRLDHVYDVMIHVEPWGDHEKETYGLSEEDINKQ